MAQHNHCHYHEQEPATWQCSGCQRFYCDLCVPRPPDELAMGRCAICSGELQFQGAGNKAEPFWHRIHSFFSYPFDNNVLLFLGTITLLAMLTSFTGFFALLIFFIYASIVTKYFFRIIELSSFGQFEPPAFAEAFTGDGFSLFFKQIGMFIVAGIALYIASKTGSTFIIFAAMALIALAMPASIMILAQEQSLGEAINPSKIVFVIRAIGWPYLILYLFLFILAGCSAWMNSMLQSVLLGPFVSIASFLVSGYFTVVMAAMMGYCLYQYQQPLGYTTLDDTLCCPDQPSYQKQLALAESHIFVKEGRFDEAISTVRNAINRGQANDFELNKRLHRLLLNSSDQALLSKHTQHYLQLLLEGGRGHEAGQVFATVSQKVKGYKPVEPKLRLELARGLYSSGRFKEAILLLKGFHQEFPQSLEIADAYLISARAFSEGLGRDDQALKLLQFILNRYPSSPLYNEAKSYCATVQQLVKSSAQ